MSPRPHLKLLARSLVVAATGCVLALGLVRVVVVGDLVLALERKSRDYRMAWYRGGRPAAGAAPSDVVVVAVDEASLGGLGRFPPWPRALHAAPVDTVSSKGAAVSASPEGGRPWIHSLVLAVAPR